MNKIIPLAIVIAGILIGGAIIFVNQAQIEKGIPDTLSDEDAAEKAINYINENLLQKGLTASLINVAEENGVYKFRLKVGEREFESYVTKNGKILFIEGINIEKEPVVQEKPEQKKLTCEDIKKANHPSLEAFVVSQCPFGLQMQRILNEIVKNIPSLTDNIRVEYIGSIEKGKIMAMHGPLEAQENLTQICLREEQSDKYWNYIDCYIQKGKIEKCLTEAEVDNGKLNNCLNLSSRGLKYAKEDFDLQRKYKVTGSPTLILNGQKVSEFDFGGRTAQAVKTLLCCGFKVKPDICHQKLNESKAATGFSERYSQSSGSSGGSCNQ